MSCSQYFQHNLMDMGPLLGTILGTALNYKTPMCTLDGALMSLILSVAHIGTMAGMHFFIFCLA